MANHVDDCAVGADLLAVREWLSEAEGCALAAHLAACPACRRREEAMAAFAAEFAPPEDAGKQHLLTAQIMMAVGDDSRRHDSRSALVVPALAALVVLELAVVVSVSPGAAAFAAKLVAALDPALTVVFGHGAELTAVWQELAGMTGGGLASAGIDGVGLASLLLAGCLAVVAACRRELFNAIHEEN